MPLKLSLTCNLLWTVYPRSFYFTITIPKSRELHGFTDIFEEQAVYYSSGSQKARWVASRHRALLALEKTFAITVKHVEHVASVTGEDAAKARGMVKAIKTEKFEIFVLST